MQSRSIGIFLAFLCSALTGAAALAQPTALSFGVVSQRSPVLTAQYWNPILRYVSRISGVPLQLKLARSGGEHAAMVSRGEFDFLYSNHNFTAESAAVGYTVFARPLGSVLRGQLVVAANSPLQSVTDLQGKTVAFPSAMAFAGYRVPMDALLRAGIRVVPQFAGNQEGALGQLASGRVQAAGINAEVGRNFTTREKFTYRVLWSSEDYPSIPLSAHPRVTPAQRDAVRDAFINMARDPDGLRILTQSAALIGAGAPYGFAIADQNDYDSTRRLYRNGLTQQEMRP